MQDEKIQRIKLYQYPHIQLFQASSHIQDGTLPFKTTNNIYENILFFNVPMIFCCKLQQFLFLSISCLLLRTNTTIDSTFLSILFIILCAVKLHQYQLIMETNIEINKPSPKFQDVSIAPMHTTEHIINQTMIRLFGCGRSISAHIERKKSKLDYLLAACPTEERNKEAWKEDR